MAMRTGRYQLPGRSQLTPDAKVQLQNGSPQRMVLLVERHVAAPVHLPAGLGPARSGAAPKMRDRRHRRKQYLATELPDRVAEIDVLGVEEETLVQQARRLRVAP